MDIEDAFVDADRIVDFWDRQDAPRRRRAKDAGGSRELRLRAIGALGGKCSCCGFRDIRALQIDHVNGGGSLERRLLGDRAIYRAAIKGDTRYQILCANCNWIKRFEKAEHNGVRG